MKIRKHSLTDAERVARTEKCQRIAAQKRAEFLEKQVAMLQSRCNEQHENNCELIKRLSSAVATLDYLNGKVARLEQETRNWSESEKHTKAVHEDRERILRDRIRALEGANSAYEKQRKERFHCGELG